LEKSNEKEQDLDLTAQRNGLRMETFFELMMLDERVQFDPGVSVMLFWGQRVQDTIWIYANGLPVEHLLGRQLGTFDILVIMRNHFHGDYCVDTDGLTNEEERYRSDQIFYYYGSFNSRVKPRATKQVMHLEFEQDEFLPDM
jgi:ribonuclease BN (tRNA processing enzyme)